MLYPRKLNIYLRFQRLSAKFGERVANGNPGIFAYKPLRISADLRDLGVQRRPERRDRGDTRRGLLKPVDSRSCDN